MPWGASSPRPWISAAPQGAKRHRRVHLDGWGEVLVSQLLGGLRRKLFLDGGQGLVIGREACRLPVAAEAPEEAGACLGAGSQRSHDIELGDAAGAGAAGVLAELVDHGRPVELVGQPGGHQADDARAEVGVSDHDQRRPGVLGGPELPGEGDCIPRQALALAVQLVEALGQAGRLPLVAGDEQVIGQPGTGDAAGGVEARPQGEGERLGIQARRVDAGHVHQGAQPRPRGARQRGQAPPHQLAVLAQQGRHVDDGAQGHQVQVLVGLEGGVQRLVESGHKLVGQAHCGQLREGSSGLVGAA